MIEQQMSVTLEQPPQRAFDYFVDFPNEPTWNPECLEVRQTSEGAVGEGTTYLGRVKGVGRVDTEIVAFDRPNGFTTSERSRVGVGTFTFLFVPVGSGTRLDVSMRLQPRGPMRILQPLMAVMARKMLGAMPDHMRRGIDAADPVH